METSETPVVATVTPEVAPEVAPAAPLTPLQLHRIKIIQTAFDHIRTIGISLFTAEGPAFIDREISIWENILAAFKAEAKIRSKLRKFDRKEQSLLLQVLLLTSIHNYDPVKLARQFPKVMDLKNFQSAVIRFMKTVIDAAGPMPELDEKLATELPPQVS